jgi:hypothetical protein
MKRFLTLAALLGATSMAMAQSVGDKVEIESTGSWYPGKILKVEDGRYYVHYDGWSDGFDEWVEADRLKFAKAAAGVTGRFKVGDNVEVEYGMVPAPAKVIEVGENKYKIQYENSLYGTKWVTEKEMKKL